MSVIFEDTELDGSILSALRQFYDSGGLVVFFGIYGEFNAPSALSEQFDLPEPWSFSAYTKHEYECTSTAMDCFGWNVKGQQYTKSNLLRVPVQDRWLVPKALPLHQYIEEHAGCLDGDKPDEGWKQGEEVAKARYLGYCEGLYEECPLAVHKNKSGGRLAYLGFVNGDGNIPYMVRSLVTNRKSY
jgi:hypothetical protein